MNARAKSLAVLASSLLSAATVSGCRDDAPKDKAGQAESPPPKPEESPAPTSDHGGEAALGSFEIGGFTFDASALGTIAAGSDAAVALAVKKAPDGRDWRTLNLYVWVEDSAGQKLSAAEKARPEKGRLHAHTSVTSGKPARVVVRLRDGDLDQRTHIELGASAGTGKAVAHTHEKTPHDGIRAAASAPGASAPSAWLELKLHDDKGDLELWLSSDKGLTTPLDLPLDSAIQVTFIDREGRQVTLAPRNTDRNEDEDGKPNIRDGKTSYFIFPGETGADASWLQGKDFQSIVTVSVRGGGVQMTSEEFVLKPHTHAPGTEHR